MARTSGDAAADHSRDRDARVKQGSLLRGLDGNICMLTHRAHVGADALSGFSHRCRQYSISADPRTRVRRGTYLGQVVCLDKPFDDLFEVAVVAVDCDVRVREPLCGEGVKERYQ